MRSALLVVVVVVVVVLGGSGVSLTKDVSACLRNRKILIERESSVLNCDLE
jgi:Sec-independent protein translocase protein TatA